MADKVGANPEMKVLHAIRGLVETKLKPEANISTMCYFVSRAPGKPAHAYVSFVWLSEQRKPQSLTHKPGISIEDLIPEKIQKLSEWIIKQIRKKQPDWFIG